MCGLLPPTRFSTVVFANAASYACVCEAREGAWQAFSTVVGCGGQIIKSVKRKVTLCREGLVFTPVISCYASSPVPRLGGHA